MVDCCHHRSVFPGLPPHARPSAFADDGPGRYRVRLARDDADVDRCQSLRWQAFRATDAVDAPGRDCDAFDPVCRHMLIEEAAGGRLVGCFRFMILADGRDLGQSYATQFYDLSRLAAYPGRMMEVGRFCLHPDVHDPDVLRIAWGAVTRIVAAERIALLFGCSSFRGTDAAAHLDAFALLKDRHIGPRRWLPKAKAPRVFRYARRLAGRTPDPARGRKGLPPLLRTYLRMGGWVSDHAVVDADLGTLHVFTGLEVEMIPRQRVLRVAPEPVASHP